MARQHLTLQALAGAAGLLLAWCAPVTADDLAMTPNTAGAAGISAPLAGVIGDATRGRKIVTDRRKGLCLLCHSGPFPEERFQGTLAPSLSGIGARLTEEQLRLRIIDSTRINPTSLMPPYHRTEGLARVGHTWRDQSIFSSQEVEDVVTFLKQLQD